MWLVSDSDSTTFTALVGTLSNSLNDVVATAVMSSAPQFYCYVSVEMGCLKIPN